MDLSGEDVDLSAIDSRMLGDSCIDGHQLSVPMGQNIYGLVVDTTLLEKEGLSVPQNRSEFEAVLAALKAKGYTPVQGPADKIYADLTAGMVFSSLCEGQPVYEALKAGDEEAAGAALSPAVELVDELVAKGYTDAAVNVEYPEDNYDQAILRFFEGDVPFWMCNTEKVSGMKKRDSRKRHFPMRSSIRRLGRTEHTVIRNPGLALRPAHRGLTQITRWSSFVSSLQKRKSIRWRR